MCKKVRNNNGVFGSTSLLLAALIAPKLMIITYYHDGTAQPSEIRAILFNPLTSKTEKYVTAHRNNLRSTMEQLSGLRVRSSGFCRKEPGALSFGASMS